ncbi:hypothetical protein Bhyg_14687 [Pseudolycoriella hygida]|uniref:Uncharacterized protein n=1 Tax=Pseudolycoriella hygida TaxID=35572 RepID=A0A9Q0RVV3_9DIPT|nr:hypothetical protein Bhyg_14687 [Pseudolycoriella hygida]
MNSIESLANTEPVLRFFEDSLLISKEMEWKIYLPWTLLIQLIKTKYFQANKRYDSNIAKFSLFGDLSHIYLQTLSFTYVRLTISTGLSTIDFIRPNSYSYQLLFHILRLVSLLFFAALYCGSYSSSLQTTRHHYLNNSTNNTHRAPVFQDNGIVFVTSKHPPTEITHFLFVKPSPSPSMMLYIIQRYLYPFRFHQMYLAVKTNSLKATITTTALQKQTIFITTTCNIKSDSLFIKGNQQSLNLISPKWRVCLYKINKGFLKWVINYLSHVMPGKFALIGADVKLVSHENVKN